MAQRTGDGHLLLHRRAVGRRVVRDSRHALWRCGRSVGERRRVRHPGNQATTSVGDINIDQTAPTITATPDTPANAAGWNNGPVTVHFTCDDATSGVAFDACPERRDRYRADGLSTVAGSVTDRAGNTATTSVVVRIDTTTPTIVGHVTPAPNGAGWNNTDVTVSFDCTDTGSGIATAGCTAPVNVPEGREPVGHRHRDRSRREPRDDRREPDQRGRDPAAALRRTHNAG